MIYVVTNALLYLALLMVYWRYKKVFDIGTLLILMWLIVSTAGVLYYNESPASWHLQLWPFLYIFFCFLLLSRYILGHKYSDKAIARLAYSRNRVVDLFCWFYTVCVVIKLVNEGLNFSALSLIQVVEDTAEAYEEHLTYEFQGGPIAYIATVYEQYFSKVCIIWGFNSLCQRQKLKSILFLAFPFIAAFGDGIMLGSRNTIVMAIIVYVCAYVLYRRLIPKKTKKVLLFSSLAIGSVVVLYLLAITESRFGIDTQAAEDNSAMAYMGQSMLQFNYGLADSMRKTYDGAMTFKNIYPLVGIDIPNRFSADSMLGTHIGTGFVTLIGFLVMDFGYIGTIIFCLIFPLIMKWSCLQNKGFTLPVMYIFLFYVSRMLRGSMVFSGPGADLSYFMLFIFALFLHFAMGLDKVLFGKKGKPSVNSKPYYAGE